jgi:signal transduction histidine kinase
LVSNALKYTEVGSVTVAVKENYNEGVEVHVIDTGCGMSESTLQKLFMPFTKIMENRHLNREGVGMGLTICQKIAKALGGKIAV